MKNKIDTANMEDTFSPGYWETDKHFFVEDDTIATDSINFTNSEGLE